MAETLQEEFEKASNKMVQELLEQKLLTEERFDTAKSYIDNTVTSSDASSRNKTYIPSYVEIKAYKNAEGELTFHTQLNMPSPDGTNYFYSKLYHEICHILTLGEIIQKDNCTCMYKWGIFENEEVSGESQEYNEAEENSIINSQEYERLNEYLTDLCAEFFFDIFMKEKGQYRESVGINPIIQICNCQKACELIDLIKCYMNLDIEKVMQILCEKANASSIDEIVLKVKAVLKAKNPQ